MRHEQGFATQLNAERVSARGELGVALKGGRSRVERLYQEGAAKIRMPKTPEGPLEAILINTAGGLTGGDRLDWEVAVGEGAGATITTQACEKLYRADGGVAEVKCGLTVAAGARLAWLPQETIVYDRSSFRRSIDIELAAGGEALILEATVFGRLAMGEAVRHAYFRDRWRVRREGHLVHAEDFAIGPGVGETLRSKAVFADALACATVLVVADDAADRLDAVREVLGSAGAASAWHVGGSGKLLARLVAADSYALRQRLVPLIELLNGRAGLPKAWST